MCFATFVIFLPVCLEFVRTWDHSGRQRRAILASSCCVRVNTGAHLFLIFLFLIYHAFFYSFFETFFMRYVVLVHCSWSLL